MPYNSNTVKKISNGVYSYTTFDPIPVYTQTNYFADFVSVHGARVNDIIIITDGVVHGANEPHSVTLRITAVDGDAATAFFNAQNAGTPSQPANPIPPPPLSDNVIGDGEGNFLGDGYDNYIGY